MNILKNIVGSILGLIVGLIITALVIVAIFTLGLWILGIIAFVFIVLILALVFGKYVHSNKKIAVNFFTDEAHKRGIKKC